jgi:hypothetical protein
MKNIRRYNIVLIDGCHSRAYGDCTRNVISCVARIFGRFEPFFVCECAFVCIKEEIA